MRLRLLALSSCALLMLLATGCGERKTQARFEAVEAENKALAAQVEKLTQVSTENAALLAETKRNGGADVDLLRELTARINGTAAAQQKADSEISWIERTYSEAIKADL